MKKKIAMLAFGLVALGSFVFIPSQTKAEKQVCFTFKLKLCEPSQGTCCYEGGTDCLKQECYNQE